LRVTDLPDADVNAFHSDNNVIPSATSYQSSRLQCAPCAFS
jgi:hypothetical protein